MNGWLLDTNVISHLSPSENQPDAKLIQWLKAHEAELWLSGVTIFEVSQGIHKQIRTGATKKASVLKAWLDTVLSAYENRIIVPDLKILVRAGELMERAIGAGIDPGLEDALIAATAEVRDLVVLTRNVRHLKPMGILCHDPFEGVP